MGSLTLPSTGLVYLDANPVICSVERHPVYWPLLQPLWQAAKGKTIEIVSSDHVLMETLVGPLKSGNAALVSAYEQLFQQAQTRLLPITHPILREAAQLRATTKLKTPRRAARRHGSTDGLRPLCHERSRLPEGCESSSGDPGRPAETVKGPSACPLSPIARHDAFDNPAKTACREGNLRVLREAAYLLWEDGDRPGCAATGAS